MIKNELMHVPPMEKQLKFKSFIMRIDKLKNISGHKKDHQHHCRWPKKGLKYIRAFDSQFVLLINYLLLKRAKEKKATSPKIKQFMPKTSEIAL